jgi:hypothetical protein
MDLILDKVGDHRKFLLLDNAVAMRQTWIVGTIAAIGLVFVVQEIMALAATALEVNWAEKYPSALQRFHMIKSHCVVKGMPITTFTERTTHSPAPEPFIEQVLYSFRDISWSNVVSKSKVETDVIKEKCQNYRLLLLEACLAHLHSF